MEWHFVTTVDDTNFSNGKSKIVTIGNKEIGVFHYNGKYYAFLNYCPHFGAEICKGRITGTLYSSEPGEFEMKHDELALRCPWHHWEFHVDSGKAVIGSIKQRARVYEVKVEDDKVFVKA